ncbi:hypothetical protein RRF57_009254 [Xylaria bambusicola]|uniref:Uncharacterized protein n=1 Tax=Xylaria bambusicola TaxID=326684 RepID=A0AAN7UJA0_9PEZI
MPTPGALTRSRVEVGCVRGVPDAAVSLSLFLPSRCSVSLMNSALVITAVIPMPATAKLDSA